MYLITMGSHDRSPADNTSPYKGAICIITGRPWYVTGKMGPDLFASKLVASASVLQFPKGLERRYEVLSVEEYMKLVGDFTGFSHHVEWLDDLRALCPKPVPSPPASGPFSDMWVVDP